jgi:hypothetical protein
MSRGRPVCHDRLTGPPEGTSAERAVLLGRLTGQRDHILEQLEGLADQQLRRPVLPSGWPCLGLVRHLTLSDERYWFEVVFAGGPLDFWPDGENADWLVQDIEPAKQGSPFPMCEPSSYTCGGLTWIADVPVESRGTQRGGRRSSTRRP